MPVMILKDWYCVLGSDGRIVGNSGFHKCLAPQFEIPDLVSRNAFSRSY